MAAAVRHSSAAKAGIMEIADIFVINKADREGAERVEREILAMVNHHPSARKSDA